MKNLQGVLAFVESVDSGTLAAGADRLNVTPAAVSKALANLERQLGVRLINRSTRRLSLTTEGAAFLVKAKGALRMLDEGIAEVSQSAQVPAGPVRLSVGVGFGRRFVLPALPSLLSRYPKISIDVDLDNRPIDLVGSGFDIGIRGGFIEDSSLIARRICALPVVLLASPAYLREVGVPVKPADLDHHRCVSVRPASGVEPAWSFRAADGELMTITPAARLTTSDPDTLIDLALTGVGIVQAGLYNAVPYLRAGRLRLLMPKLHIAGQREFVMHYPHRRYLAPRVRVVVDALLSHFAEQRDLHLSIGQIVKEMPRAVAQPRARR